MSIANDKALNLGGAKILYDDLRGRVEEKTSHKDVHDFVYSGIEEYTPGTTKTFYKGTFYHEVGSSYVCTPAVESVEFVVEAGSTEADWQHLPTTPGTTFLWTTYTLNGYIEARVAACLTSSTFVEYFIENIMEIECRTAGSSFEFNASHKIAHERGTVYICEYIGPSSYTIYGSQSFPTESDSNFNVNTIWGYIQAKFDNLDNLKAPIDAPAFTGYLRLATTNATGYGAISAGEGTSAYGRCSSAFGTGTATEMINSHVTGRYNITEHIQSRSSRKTYKVGDIVKESTGNYYKCKQGYTSPNNNTWLPSEDTTHWVPWAGYAEVVGNGTGPESSNRSNARTLDFSGNEEIAGTFKCQTSITIGNATITESQLQALLALLN